MQFLHGNALGQALRNATANTRIDAAVAYWGGDAFDLLGLDQAIAGSRVICDAFSGACNPKALTDLLDAGIEVFDLSGVHAKVYLCGKTLITGSANASANGLGQEDEEINLGLEAALSTNNEKVLAKAQSWFDQQIKRSRLLGPSDIAEITKLWLTRRNDRSSKKKMSLLSAIIANNNVLKDRRFYAVLYTPQDVKPEDEQTYKDSLFFEPSTYAEGEVPFFWGVEDWAIEAGDLILSLQVDGADVICEGPWRVQGTLRDGYIVAVKSEVGPLGLTYTGRQAKPLQQRVAKLLRNNHIGVEAQLIPMSEFAEKIVAHT